MVLQQRSRADAGKTAARQDLKSAQNLQKLAAEAAAEEVLTAESWRAGIDARKEQRAVCAENKALEKDAAVDARREAERQESDSLKSLEPNSGLKRRLKRSQSAHDILADSLVTEATKDKPCDKSAQQHSPTKAATFREGSNGNGSIVFARPFDELEKNENLSRAFDDAADAHTLDGALAALDRTGSAGFGVNRTKEANATTVSTGAMRRSSSAQGLRRSGSLASMRGTRRSNSKASLHFEDPMCE